MVGHACPACPRGVFATKDLAEGELIMRVPLSVALPVSQQDPRLLDDTPGAAEYARELLIRWQTDPSFNATWGAYWATVPQPGETLTFELFTDAELEMLQEPTLVRGAPPPCTRHSARLLSCPVPINTRLLRAGSMGKTAS